jgi:ABC-type transport system involved in multi-copper enzyme maturation permease subunit
MDLILTSGRRVALFAQFELSRFFLSRRGIIALATYTAVWAFVMYKLVANAVDVINSEEMRHFAQGFFGMIGMEKVLGFKVAEFSIFWPVAVITMPLLALFVSSDQLCSDKSRGTLRFLTLRASRNEILLGRFLGQLFVLSVFAAITMLAVIITAWIRDSSTLLDSFTLTGYLFAQLVVALVPFAAFMSFLNSYLKSSKQAIIHFFLIYVGWSAFMGLLIKYIHSKFIVMTYLMPGVQLNETAALNEALSTYLVPICQAVFYLVLASILFNRKGV